ncbi:MULTISPECIES: conjugal transfer protein TraR [unclassified Dyella]|uniref:TraR/DksA family transcriptional regulator n=1 Tax=unclassified Dyella TaxID=2634549 RepID=UPI000C85CEB1|nr:MULTISPECIES: conjugal transfer protein TraR [unclassified Dyella]MDR3446841.1 TraR/DksA family transcriptional regulator [Dyella sp.]PMQ03122.1 General stress protein 16O [Dyella sp. AD56]
MSAAPALTPEFIAQQRKRLEALRRQVLGGELDVNARKRAFTEEHGDEAEEFEDEAQSLAQEEVRQAQHDVDDQRVADIQRALEKIDEGTYGVSDESGDPIPKARLEARPESVLTVQEEEARERQR